MMETNSPPKVSVLMPAYNSEKYIRASIESVIQQTFSDFELIIVNDGSTDRTGDIIQEYLQDKRVHLFNRSHTGVANSLNYGLKQCCGEYIARFDSDDIMFRERLELQVKIMDNNRSIDILGMGMQWGNGKEKPEFFTPATGIVTKETLVRGNVIAHPTVIMRRERIMSLPFQYEPYYACEDYRMWLYSISHGLVIATVSKPVIWYRQHEGQLINNQALIWRDSVRASKSINFKNNGDLTCVIAGRNEKTEVERTLSSIRATADSVKIIFVDDASNDGWDYKSVCEIYGAKYVRNDIPLGSAGAKSKGADMVDTSYFCLFDSHMRLYDDNWDQMVISRLKENPGAILYSESYPLILTEEGDYVNENGHNNYGLIDGGVSLNLSEPGWEFTVKWNTKKPDVSLANGLIETGGIFGAFYAMSREHWNRIHGMRGLKAYGNEEPFLSLKTWLSGGKCMLISGFKTGHIYRDKAPFSISNDYLEANRLFIARFFLDDKEELTEIEENLKKKVGERAYKRILGLIDNDELEKEKRYFLENVEKVPLSDIKKWQLVL